MISESSNAQEITDFFLSSSNFLVVKDEPTCNDSVLYFSRDDLSKCMVKPEDSFYAVVQFGEVRMYREDPGTVSEIPFGLEPCLQKIICCDEDIVRVSSSS